jgi:hypothetical protein
VSSNRKEHAKPADPLLRALECVEEHLEARSGQAQPLERALELTARPVRLGEKSLCPRRALVEEGELGRERATRTLELSPESDPANDDERDGGDDEREPAEEGEEDHPGAILVGDHSIVHLGSKHKRSWIQKRAFLEYLSGIDSSCL